MRNTEQFHKLIDSRLDFYVAWCMSSCVYWHWIKKAVFINGTVQWCNHQTGISFGLNRCSPALGQAQLTLPNLKARWPSRWLQLFMEREYSMTSDLRMNRIKAADLSWRFPSWSLRRLRLFISQGRKWWNELGTRMFVHNNNAIYIQRLSGSWRVLIQCSKCVHVWVAA